MSRDFKKILKITIISIFFSLIIVYAFLRSKDLIFGVKIKDINIVNGAKLTDATLPVTGNAKNAVYVSINGREISVDQKGDFSETIALLSGYNIVDIKAIDKFGHEDEKNYKLILDTNEKN